MSFPRSVGSEWLTALVVLAGLAGNADAQGTGGPTVSDTRVGYITSAVPFDHVRLRYDSAYRNTPFTSRAEYRLTLRADNADFRLTPKAMALGVVGRGRARVFGARRAGLAEAVARLSELRLSPSAARRHGLEVKLDGVRRTGLELLRLPHVDRARLAGIWPELWGLRKDIVEQLETEARYAGYLPRQEADIAAFRADEALVLPPALDLDAIPGLSREVRARLAQVRPPTIGAAARLPGMTPAALTVLYRHARRAA